MKLVILVFVLSASTAFAQTSGSDVPTRNHLASKPCLFDFNRGLVANCILTTKAGALLIAPKIVRELAFDSHGLASVRSSQGTWFYVNRRGTVVIADVPIFDNGPDPFHDGLVRVVVKGKYGFANRRGQLVIPTVYDGAMPFENGHAAVCMGCTEECSEHDCEHHSFVGGDWSVIDVHGARVR